MLENHGMHTSFHGIARGCRLLKEMFQEFHYICLEAIKVSNLLLSLFSEMAISPVLLRSISYIYFSLQSVNLIAGVKAPPGSTCGICKHSSEVREMGILHKCVLISQDSVVA